MTTTVKDDSRLTALLQDRAVAIRETSPTLAAGLADMADYFEEVVYRGSLSNTPAFDVEEFLNHISNESDIEKAIASRHGHLIRTDTLLLLQQVRRTAQTMGMTAVETLVARAEAAMERVLREGGGFRLRNGSAAAKVIQTLLNLEEPAHGTAELLRPLVDADVIALVHEIAQLAREDDLLELAELLEDIAGSAMHVHDDSQ